MDASEDFVFSGGGDKTLRIWSLRTGQALPARNEATESRVIDNRGAAKIMTCCIRALEIVESDAEVVLWMAFENCLDKVVLGPKGLLL